jgi:two-component system, chemotaxis family, CheB/CheR fusion protein
MKRLAPTRSKVTKPRHAGQSAGKSRVARAQSKQSANHPRSSVTDKNDDPQQVGTTFPIVGIGASAGGLEAFRQLLEHMPVDTGMAFVLVQHLDPTHKSILSELLARSTRLPVSEVSDGMRVAPDHVYVIPPNTCMAITEGALYLQPREEGHAGRRPIDYFLRALAEDQRHLAIGVILSGTDSDGTLGLEAIKAEGGINFAQDPNSAKYDGMPHSAIVSGHVDFILPPEGIAQELARISRHPYVMPAAGATTRVQEEPPLTGSNGFRKILSLLRKARGVDFTDYKANTLHRRITRRMVLNKLDSMEEYGQYLRENATEVEALYQDILINVTSFFRNPETFVVLKEKIFPQVVEQRTQDEPIRVWTLGCSTGEEAYSIAISFLEFAVDRGEHIPIQIFATDLSDRGIEKARAGLYSKEIAGDVSPELRRFFTEAEGGYRISKPIRDMVVFARQNVITDPPFSRLDMISCRNLLIYMEPVLQKQVLPALHYALKPTGVLWLGSSETPGSSSDLFAPQDKKHRFYSKNLASTRLHFQSARGEIGRDRTASGEPRNQMSERLRSELDAQKESDRILLARYSPASVLINTELEILQFRGSTGAYLEPPPGKATLNLLKMAREGLMLPLRAAIQKAKRDDATVRKEGVRIDFDGESRQVNLEVIPIKDLTTEGRSFLVLFERAPFEAGPPEKRKAKGVMKRKAEDRQVTRLQEELATTREYMQSLVEQHEAANEELQSSSEEIQSSNEELQSINEELETAKEELESSNEELATLNDELNSRNQELTTLNDDLNNLNVNAGIPIITLGRDLRIRRFTRQAEKVLSLVGADVGRSISDLNLKLNVPDLGALIIEAISNISVKEREVQDKQGRWYRMRIGPYKTVDNRIDGAVVVLEDIDALKRSEVEIKEARDFAEAVIRTTRDPLLILNADLSVHKANEAFYDTFDVSPAEAEGRLIYELGNRQWDIPGLRQLLEDILPRDSFFNNFEVSHDFDSIGQRTMTLNARRLHDGDGQPARILLGIQDVTAPLQLQAAMRRSEVRYRRLFEAAMDGVLIIDPETRRILDANPFAAELLGYTRQELLGRELFEVGLFRDESASREAFRELRENAFVRYDDLPLEAKGDKHREVEFVSNLYNADGEEFIQCNVRETTERNRAEQALREGEERYRTLFDLGPVAVYSCDTSGVILEFNHRAVELWGRAPALGDTEERFCGSFKLFRPDGTYMPHHQCPMADVLTGKISETRNAEVCIERPDGSRITVIVNIRPLTDELGEVTGAINCFYDITERKKTEEALRESETRFRELADAMPQMVWAARPDGYIDYYNRRWYEYTGLAESHGPESWEPILHPDDVERCVATYFACIREGNPYQIEYRFKDRQGDYRWFMGRALPIRNEQDEIVRWFGTCTDIDDVKRSEEEREQLLQSNRAALALAESANRVKDEFLATISHELRTPLNAMMGWADMLRRGSLDESTAIHAYETIARNARLQNQLISDLLDVSRIISGKLRLEVSAVELLHVIGGAIDTVRPAADARRVEIDLVAGNDVGLVSGDAGRLQQVVWNLLSNAIKYSPMGGRVGVRLERQDSNVAIIVHDTGEGIRADVLPHIFDRFRQADSATTRRHGGLGLGLAIVQHLVEKHGGTVHAESGGAGQGSTFTVTLPVIAVKQKQSYDKPAYAGDAPAGPAPIRLNAVRILVVDDDPDNRELLSVGLKAAGAELKVAASVRDALAILDHWTPDVLVSDIGMPDEDGYTLIKEVRARNTKSGGLIPAIALTGYARETDAARAREAGFQMHLTKPVESTALIAAVANVFGSRLRAEESRGGGTSG